MQMRIEIQKDQDYTFTWSFYDKNIQEIPTTGTIKVYKPGGSTLVDTTSVSINSAGTISYTLLAANTGTIDYNYKIELKYTVDGVEYRPFYLFDIAETPLQNTTRDEDLFQYVEELRDKVKPFTRTTTDTGTTTTLISDELESLNIDFKGGDLKIFITDTTAHRAEITAWNSTTNTATFTPAYSTNIATDLTFNIRGSYQRFINTAYENHVTKDIRNRIGLKARFIDTTVTDNMTIFKALELICFSKVEETEDKWEIRAKKFKQDYSDEYGKLSEPVDYNDDGTISDGEDASRPSFLNKNLTR
jgi:hypothetical protein